MTHPRSHRGCLNRKVACVVENFRAYRDQIRSRPWGVPAGSSHPVTAASGASHTQSDRFHRLVLEHSIARSHIAAGKNARKLE